MMAEFMKTNVSISFMEKEVVALVIKPTHLWNIWIQGSLYSTSPIAHFIDESKPKMVKRFKDLVIAFNHPEPSNHYDEYDLKKWYLEHLFEKGRTIERSKLKGGL